MASHAEQTHQQYWSERRSVQRDQTESVQREENSPNRTDSVPPGIDQGKATPGVSSTYVYAYNYYATVSTTSDTFRTIPVYASDVQRAALDDPRETDHGSGPRSAQTALRVPGI